MTESTQPVFLVVNPTSWKSICKMHMLLERGRFKLSFGLTQPDFWSVRSSGLTDDSTQVGCIGHECLPVGNLSHVAFIWNYLFQCICMFTLALKSPIEVWSIKILYLLKNVYSCIALSFSLQITSYHIKYIFYQPEHLCTQVMTLMLTTQNQPQLFLLLMKQAKCLLHL